MKQYTLALLLATAAFGQFGPPPQPLAQTKASAPWDLTGTWVALVTEDWRFRMVVPPKGDFPGLPLNAEARKVAGAFDASKVDPCSFYGAPAIMRVPGRVRISWQDDTTLKLEMDAGTQTRLLRFKAPENPGAASLQGNSQAMWEASSMGGRGARIAADLKVVTNNLTAGFLRKNGVPYSANARVTEYFDVHNDPNSKSNEVFLIIKTIVDDPTYLATPMITSTNFRKQADNAGWNPTACSAK